MIGAFQSGAFQGTGFQVGELPIVPVVTPAQSGGAVFRPPSRRVTRFPEPEKIERVVARGVIQDTGDDVTIATISVTLSEAAFAARRKRLKIAALLS